MFTEVGFDAGVSCCSDDLETAIGAIASAGVTEGGVFVDGGFGEGEVRARVGGFSDRAIDAAVCEFGDLEDAAGDVVAAGVVIGGVGEVESLSLAVEAGEDELLALVEGTLRVLKGEEEAKIYE